MKRPKRVLFLDGNDLGVFLSLPVFVQKGQVTVTAEDDPSAEYEPTETYLNALERLTAQPNHFDLVILGSNMGSGLRKACRINAELRSKTIVVANSDINGATRDQYQSLGYTQFMTRTQLNMVLGFRLGLE